MRILLLSTYFRPDIASTGVIMTKLAEEFVAKGHEVTVVTSVPHYDPNRVGPEWSKKLVYRERREGMTIYRVRVRAGHDKSSVAARILGYASFSLLSALRAATLPRHDVILSPSPPLSNGVIADFISRLRGAPFVYNVQDIWPDVAVRAGVLKNGRAMKCLKAMERYVYDRAAKISVISEGFKRNLSAKGVPDGKISVIPNFIDTDFVTPQPKQNSFSRKHALENKFVVLFAGNMGFSQALENALGAAKLLEANEEIKFLMVGNGAAKNAAESYCESAGLRNVEFLPFQAHEDVPAMYGAADVCLIPLKRGFSAESVPCKLFTIMAAGKPAIAAVDRYSDTWELIRDAECGICVKPENPRALAETINRYYLDPSARCEAGRNARHYIERHFRPSTIAQCYLDVMRAAVTPPAIRVEPSRLVRQEIPD
ncbi:MAG: glycosyltransferase family 4 protein [Terriglobia bacterium]|jgi:colanic acid biosynthesis glycosyl transferase WcaI